MDNKLRFKNAVWIWENGAPQSDEYAEFKGTFFATGGKNRFLSVSVDSNYSLYINGVLADFGQYPDYPFYKVGDRVDITPFVKEGENEYLFVVWYYGRSNMTYSVGKAGIIFEIDEEGEILAFSSEGTQSRLSSGYVSHNNTDITEQLGLSYEYDAASADEGGAFSDSVKVEGITLDINKRPIKKTLLRDRTDFRKAFGGTYRFVDPTGKISPDMQKAALTFIRADRSEGLNTPFSLVSDNGENLYFIIDLCAEECGFLDFDITVPEKCDIFVAYGEHLAD
ncbi:MAG: hypothetical protein J5940_03575, partial [Clostridia bacterium]|nr:hypothetical protein [Clostridia bacterium]